MLCTYNSFKLFPKKTSAVPSSESIKPLKTNTHSRWEKQTALKATKKPRQAHPHKRSCHGAFVLRDVMKWLCLSAAPTFMGCCVRFVTKLGSQLRFGSGTQNWVQIWCPAGWNLSSPPGKTKQLQLKTSPELSGSVGDIGGAGGKSSWALLWAGKKGGKKRNSSHKPGYADNSSCVQKLSWNSCEVWNSGSVGVKTVLCRVF